MLFARTQMKSLRYSVCGDRGEGFSNASRLRLAHSRFGPAFSPCDALGGASMAHDNEREDTKAALMDSAGVAVARPEDSTGNEAGGRWLRARGHWNKGLSLLRRVAAVAEPAVTVGFNVARNNAHSHLRAW
jgi:hypothetical protein